MATKSQDLTESLLKNDSGSSPAHTILQVARKATVSNQSVIQFLSEREYSVEGKGNSFLSVDVIRVGSTDGRCSVAYKTTDRAAKAGQKYTAVEGTLVFEHQQADAKIMIEKLNDDQYIPVSSFEVRLSDSIGCQIDPLRDVCHITLLDDDCFPDNALKDILDEKKVNEIPVLTVMKMFYKFVFNMYGVGGQIKWVMLGDQIHNLYALAMNFLNAYLIKEVLATNSDPSLLLTGDRFTTLYLLGFATVSPYVVFFFWDLHKTSLGIPDQVAGFLQASIFRTYFNLYDSVRSELTTTFVSDVMLHESHTCAYVSLVGFMNLVNMIGALLVNLYFTIAKAPTFSIYFIVFSASFGYLLTYEVPKTTVGPTKGPPKLNLAQRFTGLVSSVAKHHSIMDDYDQVLTVMGKFDKLVDEGITTGIKNDVNGTSKKYLPQVLSGVLAAVFLAVAGSAVIDGGMDLGAFVVTLKVVQANGAALAKLHGTILTLLKSSSAIRIIAAFLRLETDILDRKKALHDKKVEYVQRRDHFKKKRDELPDDSPMKKLPVRDMMYIEVVNVSLAFGDNKVLHQFSAKVRQGTVTAIVGPHSCGKRTLCKTLCGIHVPDAGHVFVPAHLRLLHVERFPDLMKTTLWENLTYGITDVDDMPSYERVETILRAIAIDDEDVMETMLMDILEAEHKTGPVKNWWRKLTQTDHYLVTLARALVFDPEVLVIERLMGMFNEEKAQKVLQTLHKHVNNRGIAEDPSTKEYRRPRTVLFVALDSFAAIGKKAAELPPNIDTIWWMDMDGGIEVQDKETPL